jgi:hypothetical protein
VGDRIEELFGEVRRYPGSKREIPDRTTPTKKTRRQVDEGAWDEHPIHHGGIEYFTLGKLAKALDRAPYTVREWEQKGIIPKARYRTASSNSTKARRLYTRAQVEGIARLAREEGLMDGKRRPIPLTFVHRVRDLFLALEAKP